MEHWNLDEIGRTPATEARYDEFLRRASMSAGVYVIPAGASDPQRPHGEDEVYVVLTGRATIAVADERRPVGAGAVVFVGREVVHRFDDVTEDLRLLVFFAPAETGGGDAGASG